MAPKRSRNVGSRRKTAVDPFEFVSREAGSQLASLPAKRTRTKISIKSTTLNADVAEQHGTSSVERDYSSPPSQSLPMDVQEQHQTTDEGDSVRKGLDHVVAGEPDNNKPDRDADAAVDRSTRQIVPDDGDESHRVNVHECDGEDHESGRSAEADSDKSDAKRPSRENSTPDLGGNQPPVEDSLSISLDPASGVEHSAEGHGSEELPPAPHLEQTKNRVPNDTHSTSEKDKAGNRNERTIASEATLGTDKEQEQRVSVAPTTEQNARVRQGSPSADDRQATGSPADESHTISSTAKASESKQVEDGAHLTEEKGQEVSRPVGPDCESSSTKQPPGDTPSTKAGQNEERRAGLRKKRPRLVTFADGPNPGFRSNSPEKSRLGLTRSGNSLASPCMSPSGMLVLTRSVPVLKLIPTAHSGSQDDGLGHAVVDELQYILDDLSSGTRWSTRAKASLTSLSELILDTKRRGVMKEHKLVTPTADGVALVVQKHGRVAEASGCGWFVLALLSMDPECAAVMASSAIFQSATSAPRCSTREATTAIVDPGMAKTLKTQVEYASIREICEHRGHSLNHLLRMQTLLNLLYATPKAREYLDSNQDCVIEMVKRVKELLHQLSMDSKNESTRLLAKKLLGILEYAATTGNSRSVILPLARPFLTALDTGNSEISESSWSISDASIHGGCLRVLINLTNSRNTISSFVRHRGVSIVVAFLHRTLTATEVTDTDARIDNFDNRVLSIALLAQSLNLSRELAAQFLEERVEDVSALEFVVNLLGTQSAPGPQSQDVNNRRENFEAPFRVTAPSAGQDTVATDRMERGVTVGYLAWLIGALWRVFPESRGLLRACLPGTSGPTTLADVLDEFLHFQKEAGGVSASMQSQYQEIMASLMEG